MPRGGPVGPSQRYARLLSRRSGESSRSVDDSMVQRESFIDSNRHSTNVVTQTVNFKTPSDKKGQAWRYKGWNILRAESNLINGRLYTDPREDNHKTDTGLPRRKNESNFFITINPNKQVPPEHCARMQAQFKSALEFIAQPTEVATYLKFGPKDFENFGADKAVDVIKKIDWDSNVEIGEEKKRMHAHIWLTIEHYSQIQVDSKLLQWAFKKAYNRNLALDDIYRIKTLPYVQVKLLPQSDWTTVMRQYIRKAIGPQ